MIKRGTVERVGIEGGRGGGEEREEEEEEIRNACT